MFLLAELGRPSLRWLTDLHSIPNSFIRFPSHCIDPVVSRFGVQIHTSAFFSPRTAAIGETVYLGRREANVVMTSFEMNNIQRDHGCRFTPLLPKLMG